MIQKEQSTYAKEKNDFRGYLKNNETFKAN